MSHEQAYDRYMMLPDEPEPPSCSTCEDTLGYVDGDFNGDPERCYTCTPIGDLLGEEE